MKHKISVIVPCYSVGKKLLIEAIESIQNQTYKNWEIILIDDCSPKKEWEIDLVDKLIKEDKLRLIRNQTNLGLAISRNVGFDSSNGDIILFLDSDDKYSKNNFFKYLNEKFNEFSNLDVIQFDYELIFENKKEKMKKYKPINKYFEKMKIKDYFSQHHIIATWAKAYKKSFLINNNIRHLDKNTPCEDQVFCFQVFIKNPNTYITSEEFYFYRKRENSIMDKIEKYKKNNDFYSIKIIKNDIEEYINRGGWNVDLQQSKIWILSESILSLILKYGLKKCEKELKISKNLLKQMLKFQKNVNGWKTKIAIIFRVVLKPIRFVLRNSLKIFFK